VNGRPVRARARVAGVLLAKAGGVLSNGSPREGAASLNLRALFVYRTGSGNAGRQA
jgi:hypothetical protein